MAARTPTSGRKESREMVLGLPLPFFFPPGPLASSDVLSPPEEFLAPEHERASPRVISSRWTTVTPSQFAWEREALDFLKAGLPDHEPFRAWSNFEFLTSTGQIYEVDLLVLSKLGFWLVEIKGRPGVISGDSLSWTWTDTDGRRVTVDNPYLLANRKAKALASLLRAQPSARKAKVSIPFIEALVFISDPRAERKLEGAAASHVLLRDRPVGDPNGERKGILAAILRRDAGGLEPSPRSTIDAPVARAITNALKDLTSDFFD